MVYAQLSVRVSTVTGMDDLLGMLQSINCCSVVPLGFNPHPIKHQCRVSLCIEVL